MHGERRARNSLLNCERPPQSKTRVWNTSRSLLLFTKTFSGIKQLVTLLRQFAVTKLLLDVTGNSYRDPTFIMSNIKTLHGNLVRFQEEIPSVLRRAKPCDQQKR